MTELKKLFIALTILLMTLTLTACHEHAWQAASCTAPKTCSDCGETEGNALGHAWKDATCDAPKTCTTCGATEGSPRGHTWKDATCIAPKTCSSCGTTESSTLAEHTWEDATCGNPKTCSSCGTTEGSALENHTWEDATCAAPKTCSVCSKTEGEALAHTWNDATCTAPKTCSVCGKTEGSLKAHSWQSATCQTPKTCSSCGKTEGSSASHSWKAATCTSPKTCSSCGKTEGSIGNHSWKAATCTTPKTCSSCGKTEGSTISHSWKSATCTSPKTCSSCGKTEGYANGHNWKAATCTAAKTCSSCGKTEGYANGHSWQSATCTAPKTCSSCGKTEGSKGSHSYSSGSCKYCGASDPNYVPTFKAGETWTVADQWELSFQNAVQTVVKNGKQTVEVVWKYKNLGYNGKLNIGMSDFDVYDSEMEVCDWTFYDVDDNNHNGANCIVGAKGTCCMGWILNNSSSTMKIYVELMDSNKQTRKAYFELNVVLPEDEPEEDKLNGCTITVDATLPKTISYYTYSGTKQSSCSVTEIRFEVSGDDLYIYFTGRKTYDSRGSGQSDSCKIGWKLYDSDNYVVDSGTAYTLSLATGEGFKDTKDTAYDCITPGETYTLVIMNVN